MIAIIAVLLLVIIGLFICTVALTKQNESMQNDLFTNMFEIADLNAEIKDILNWKTFYQTMYNQAANDRNDAHQNLEMMLEREIGNTGSWIKGYTHVATEIGINGVIYQFNKIEEPEHFGREQILSIKDIKNG